MERAIESFIHKRQAKGIPTVLRDYFVEFGGMLNIAEMFADGKFHPQDAEFIQNAMRSEALSAILQAVYARKSYEAVASACAKFERLIENLESVSVSKLKGGHGA